MRLTLKGVRLAFPQLFEPKAVQPGDAPAYSASFLFPKKEEIHKKVLAAMKKVAVEKWGEEDGTKLFTGLVKQERTCLRDGDLKDYEGFAENMYVSARSKIKPGVRNKDKSVLEEKDGLPYAGCYVLAIVSLWAQDFSDTRGKRINAALEGVQFMADGDAFVGGAPLSDDDFEDLSDTGEDNDTGEGELEGLI